MANANEVSGVLQACYSLGATIAPLIVTSLIENTRAGWWVFYHIMVCPNEASYY
jgi:fucose permease